MKPFSIALSLCFAATAQDPAPGLTAADVQSVVANAAQSVNVNTLVIAVTDRQEQLDTPPMPSMSGVEQGSRMMGGGATPGRSMREPL